MRNVRDREKRGHKRDRNRHITSGNCNLSTRKPKRKKDEKDYDDSFSEGGLCECDDCLVGGDLDDDGWITSDILLLDCGGDDDLFESTCILSSLSLWFGGEGAVDAGDNVAIGGSAIDDVEALGAACTCACPLTPIGLGWGGRTAGKDGLGGY